MSAKQKWQLGNSAAKCVNTRDRPLLELEVFNAVGDTFAVVTARESQIESLRNDELLSVRPQKLAIA
jgi:hypothetical protein